MARLIPAAIDEATPRSERDILETFKREFPAAWMVLHGQRVAVRSPQRAHLDEIELDIVVIDPARGLLCIEVKGGEIEREGGQWYSTNRSTRERHPIKDPGKQSLAASHSLVDFLDRLPANRLPGGSPPFAWAVAFPDVITPGALGPDLPRELVMDKNDLKTPARAVDRAFSHSLRGLPSHSFDARPLLEAIAPDFKLVPLLRHQVDDHESMLVRLTEEQLEIIESLDAMTKVAVHGPAGTGKTLVATERARRLAARGAKVLVLCYNTLLGEHIARSARGFTVRTFHSLCEDLCAEANVPFIVPQDPALHSRFFDDECVRLLGQALDRLPDARFDAVIVDEAQDFRTAWWGPVQRLLRDPQDGHFWVFWDPHQKIFNGETDVAGNLGLPNFNCL